MKQANNRPLTAREPKIGFHEEDERPVRKTRITSNMTLLNGTRDFRVLVDLRTPLQFPVHIQTDARLDIVAWSDSKGVLLVELTVPWENM